MHSLTCQSSVYDKRDSYWWIFCHIGNKHACSFSLRLLFIWNSLRVGYFSFHLSVKSFTMWCAICCFLISASLFSTEVAKTQCNENESIGRCPGDVAQRLDHVDAYHSVTNWSDCSYYVQRIKLLPLLNLNKSLVYKYYMLHPLIK